MDIVTDNFNLILPVISLVIAIFSLFFSIFSYLKTRKDIEDYKRIDFLRDMSYYVREHNWKFIEYWEFPGVYPGMLELQPEVPQNNDPRYQESFGRRVVALQHLGILMQVFSQRKILKPEDIVGYKNWAKSWFVHFKNALEGIMESGDIFPLDFIIWLREEILDDTTYSFNIGGHLKSRIDAHKDLEKARRKSIRYRLVSWINRDR